MNFQKILSQFQLEILALVVFGLFYLLLRYLIIRRPITYAEYEKWFLRGAAFALFVLLIYLTLRF